MIFLLDPNAFLGEHGELVGKIAKGDPFREFDGYVNHVDSHKKMLKDVFSKGDTAFLSGLFSQKM